MKIIKLGVPFGGLVAISQNWEVVIGIKGQQPIGNLGSVWVLIPRVLVE